MMIKKRSKKGEEIDIKSTGHRGSSQFGFGKSFWEKKVFRGWFLIQLCSEF